MRSFAISTYNIYLSHGIIDSFPRISKLIIKIKTSFVSQGLRPLAADETGLNLKNFHFDIRGKLSIIPCDKYILSHFIL